MREIKNSPQVYTTQECLQEIENNSGIHYPRGYRRD